MRMLDTVITLIGPSVREQDDTGVWRTSGESSTDVFAQVSSINRREFFSAGQSGLQPEHQFTIFAGEYNGESVCVYGGKRYAIYRTYHVPGTDYLELYVQREAGVQRGT